MRLDRPLFLTGKALPAEDARAIEAAADAFAASGQIPAEPTPGAIRDSFIRGAVAGCSGAPRAISDSPMAQAHRAGHQFGVGLRRRVAA